jgi:serine protease AprX
MPLFTPNYPYSQPGDPALLSTGERTGALPEYGGRGVVIAFVDSGFYPHPDLAGRVLVHVDATKSAIVESSELPPASDQSWHGLMTSVIAAGDGRTSGGRYRGIAWASPIVLVKVSNPRGQVKESDILRGLKWLVENHQRFNVRVVNLSVGGDRVSADAEHPIHAAVRRLSKEGVVVLAASGNSGAAQIVPPASAVEAITIGGINDHNTLDAAQWRLYHHNYGLAYDGTSKPDVLAPAAWIVSPIMPETSVAREAYWLGPLLQTGDQAGVKQLLKQGYSSLGLTYRTALRPDPNVYAMIQARIHAHKIVDAHHQHVDGTSVAVAIASSVAAQILEANPNLTPAQVRALMMSTAHRLPDIAAERQGAGVMDAGRAVRAAATPPTRE